MHRLAAEPRSIAGLLFPCQYFCGTILVTPYSMVWAWQISRVGPMASYWLSCPLHFCLLLFFLFILSFYLLVLWGWGLRADRVLISLSQPCITNHFNNKKNNNYLIRSRNIAIIVAVKKIHEREMKYARNEEREMKSHLVTDPLGENKTMERTEKFLQWNGRRVCWNPMKYCNNITR